MIYLNDSILEAIVEKALTAWNLTVTKIKLISKSENVVFRLDTATNGSYVLRIHRPGYHTLIESDSEHQWTAALNQTELQVPVPKKTRDGSGYVCVPVSGSTETRYVGLVEWFEGQPLSDRLNQSSDAHILRQCYEQVGRIAAKIHSQAATWQMPTGFQRQAFDADGLMGENPFWGQFWDLPMMSAAERKYILRMRRAIHHILSAYGQDQGTYSMIHADLHPDNLLINETHLFVIDFDDSGFGWHQYELAIALYYVRDQPHFEAAQEALIAGYRTERPLADEAIDLIPLFILIRTLALIGWTYARPELGKQARIPRLITSACEQADGLGL